MNEKRVMFADSDSCGSGCAGGSIGRIGTKLRAGGTTGETAGGGCCARTTVTMSATAPATATRIGLTLLMMVEMLTLGRAATSSLAMDAFTHDLRYAIRGLLRMRGVAVVAIATLALGIGATTTM